MTSCSALIPSIASSSHLPASHTPRIPSVATYSHTDNLFTVSLPCLRSPLKNLPLHRPGCWARHSPGCPQSTKGVALNAVNWTRVHGRDRESCLALTQQKSIEARCPKPGGRHRGAQVAHVSNRKAGPCTASQRTLPFQTPKGKGPNCASVGDEPNNITMNRYLTNHGHQAELLMPILDDAVREGEAPKVLHWSWRRTHWIKEVLKAMLPFTRLDTSRIKPGHCELYKPLGSGGGRSHWLKRTATAEHMRRAVQRHCGLRERPIPIDPVTGRRRERVVVLLRGDTQQQPNATLAATFAAAAAAAAATATAAATAAAAASSTSSHRVGLVASENAAERRPFANLSYVLRTLRLALPGASVRVATTFGKASICTQAKWVHGASILLSAHGAHLTNAMWMRRGSLLIEVMPWGLWEYAGYDGLYHAAGLSHHRIKARRPPANEPHWNASGSQEHNEARCASTQECRLFYRAYSNLHFGRAELCRGLRLHVDAARESGVCANGRN